MPQKRHQKNERDRPRNSQKLNNQNEQKQNNEQIKQFWTQHRITLIAYEAQYIYNKKYLNTIIQQNNNNPITIEKQGLNQKKNIQKQHEKEKQIQIQQNNQKNKNQQQKSQAQINPFMYIKQCNNKKQSQLQQNNSNQNLQKNINKSSVHHQQTQKKRKGRKKADPLYETGFLFYSNNKQKAQYLDQQLNILQVIKGHQNLQKLFLHKLLNSMTYNFVNSQKQCYNQKTTTFYHNSFIFTTQSINKSRKYHSNKCRNNNRVNP